MLEKLPEGKDFLRGGELKKSPFPDGWEDAQRFAIGKNNLFHLQAVKVTESQLEIKKIEGVK